MEKEQSGGQVINMNPEQIRFDQQITAWLKSEITYDELMESYPSYLLSIPERVMRSVKRLLRPTS